jgi:hypothetical protein
MNIWVLEKYDFMEGWEYVHVGAMNFIWVAIKQNLYCIEHIVTYEFYECKLISELLYHPCMIFNMFTMIMQKNWK